MSLSSVFFISWFLVPEKICTSRFRILSSDSIIRPNSTNQPILSEKEYFSSWNFNFDSNEAFPFLLFRLMLCYYLSNLIFSLSRSFQDLIKLNFSGKRSVSLVWRLLISIWLISLLGKPYDRLNYPANQNHLDYRLILRKFPSKPFCWHLAQLWSSYSLVKSSEKNWFRPQNINNSIISDTVTIEMSRKRAKLSKIQGIFHKGLKSN